MIIDAERKKEEKYASSKMLKQQYNFIIQLKNNTVVVWCVQETNY